MNPQPTGYVIYRGPSRLNGRPIVVVALVSQSENEKTGPMMQTYILSDETDPGAAAGMGLDESVCGDCKNRPIEDGPCYVVLFHGPASVYRTLRAGRYPALASAAGRNTAAARRALAQLGAGWMVRLGTYGDPGAVPLWVWWALVSQAEGRTGYTHQWANPRLQLAQLRELVMASADTVAEARRAHARGWRYFRIRPHGGELLPGEFVCPASKEAGYRKTCAECGACSGNTRGIRQASVAIEVHGPRAGRYIPIALAA